VLTAVRGLLFDESVDLRLLLLRDFVAKVPNALDEEGFPLREGEREAVVKGGCNGIAAIPPTIRASAAREHHVAWLDLEVRGSN
jgi:hypothetical protein